MLNIWWTLDVLYSETSKIALHVHVFAVPPTEFRSQKWNMYMFGESVNSESQFYGFHKTPDLNNTRGKGQSSRFEWVFT